MFCQKCGKEIDDNATSCPNCGNSIIVAQITSAQGPIIANEKKQGNKSNKKTILIVIASALVAVILFNIVMILGMQSKYVDEKYTYDYLGYTYWEYDILEINRFSVEIDNAGTYHNIDVSSKIIFWDWIGNTIYLKGGGKIKLSDGKAKYYSSSTDTSPKIFS